MYGIKELMDLSRGVNSTSNYSEIEMAVYVRVLVFSQNTDRDIEQIIENITD